MFTNRSSVIKKNIVGVWQPQTTLQYKKLSEMGKSYSFRINLFFFEFQKNIQIDY
jgi:hypothetical protein